MSSITEMVQFRLEGWDKSIGSWLEVEVEASSFEDAAQIAKYRDNFERIIDTQAMSIDRRSERRNENSRELDNENWYTEENLHEKYATVPEAYAHTSNAIKSDYEEALYLSALQIALRKGYADRLRYCDMQSSGYRFRHYYIRDSRQKIICKVNLREAQRGRDMFLATYMDNDGWDETILDQAKKEALFDKINRA